RKIILGGSPTIKGMSEVEREMKLTDQRYFHVPCPICREYQVLRWSNVVWDKKLYTNHEVFGDYLPETARLKCISCGKEYSNAEKNEQLGRGQWEATAAFNGAAGFYMSELMSPFPKARLQDIAEKFLEAKKHLKAGDPTLMITFVNTSLGETWEEKGVGVETVNLLDNLEPFNEGSIDEKILVITAAVDVQDDRLELEIVGWGVGQESWGLGYIIILGDPERGQVWEELDKIIFEKEFKRGVSKLKIKCTCVDSGAHTDAVYNYILGKPKGKNKMRQASRVYAVKGKSTTGDPVVSKPSSRSLRKGLRLYPLGVDTAKDVIYGRLDVDEPGPGFCHFPEDYPDEYFKQLTA
ncbi:MAG: phage terminase large subunit family protein, partial [bacterium]|nr:phage terminase large subunit family protein [bacterium]